MSGCYKRVNFYDLCRLCAQNIQKNKIKIFEYEGQKNQLQSKIKKCLAINIKEDDFLPKVVCSKCIKQLEICNAFREECLNSETMLSSYFKNYRHTEDFKKSGKVYIKDTVKSDLPYTGSPDIGKKPDQIGILQSKQNGKSPSPPNKKLKPDSVGQNCISQAQMHLPYSIDMINEAFKKAVQQLPKELLNKVIVNSNGEVINLSPQEPLPVEPQVIKNKPKRKDEVRGGKFLGQDVIKIDLTNEDASIEVPTTKYSGMPYGKSGQSIIQPAPQNPTVIFPVPQYQNNTYTSVPTSNVYPQQATVSIPTSNSTVINVICSNPSEAPPMAQNQPTSINMEDLHSLQVPLAPATPKNSKSDPVKNSSKSEDLPKVHGCGVCFKSFKRREHLYQHIKLHTGFRPYQCTECKKTFVRKEHLLRHMVLHSGERNFACDICSKSFSRHDNLLKHIRTHNKEPTYTCDICQKVFIIKHYYDSHRSEHGKCFLPPHC